MTDREKMIEVIKQAFKEEGRMFKEQAKRVLSGEIKKASQELPPIDEFIADALIAAGFGDVKETEHRATITKRALDDCVEYYSYSALCPVLDCNYNKMCWRKECTSDIVECFKIQAEKELLEVEE